MSILILYGSETGTAQDTAEGLCRDAQLRKVAARVVSLDEYDIDNLPSERVVFFVVSTTGQGEMPPNMRSSWRRLLRKFLPADWLTEVKMAVLGLGDSSYQKYNFAGKKIYRRLLQLGAQMMAPLGLADDQHEIGIDGALIPWKQTVWQELYKSCSFKEMLEEADTNIVIPPKFKIVKAEAPLPESCSKDGKEQDYYELDVLSNVRATSEDHFQDTRLLRFLVHDHLADRFKYEPGDVLMVRPYNNDETLCVAIESLGYSDQLLDEPIYLCKNSEFAVLPPPWLLGADNPSNIISQNEMEKMRLSELGSPHGLDDLLNYCTRVRRTVAETLRDFPETAKSVAPEHLFDFISPIRPRAFSIASSPSRNPNVIELLVAKVDYKSRMSERRRGLCSTFLANLKAHDKVFGRIRGGTFKFPLHLTPVICVGPGTGVAPFRSFLQFRDELGERQNALLFFGCRGEQKDYYFKEEWLSLRNAEVITAFSRDADSKVYVQHKILELAEKVWQIIGKANGMVFIAGSSGDMPKAVVNALNEVAASHGVPDWVAKAEATGKIQYETWS
ncbi:unnamed protein product [Caenorhabditis auriculariae]|uniref:NADPH-dependent FMN and FAD-containing oxidoreductase n=1 Tax=Caenorhabditis auriculariae TaxID=2777116 RepID=A0A8S1HHK0_9PELO|nr:unnamed protein product [Caenorhabditis auriculariae]